MSDAFSANQVLAGRRCWATPRAAVVGSSLKNLGVRLVLDNNFRVLGRRIVVESEDISYGDLLFWAGLTGGYHLPATVAPMGVTKGGLPLGVQIAGPIYGDRTTLAAAALLEQAGLGFKPPPGW